MIRIVKTKEKSKKQQMLLRLAAFVLALCAGGLFLLVLGNNPFAIYGTILSGAFRSEMAIQATIKIMIPLLIASLGVMLAFKMKFWNIGGEGQLIMGGVFASYFALFHADWPGFILFPVMFIAGIIGGGIWALIPAFFKVKFGTNETLFTLMLNYIALYLVSWLQEDPWRDPAANGFPKIASFDKSAVLPKLFGVQIGWVIALILVAVLFVYLRYTKQGYEISVVGESRATATYAGMNVQKIILRTMFLSGAVAGIAGMVQVTGSDRTLTTGVAGGVGFTAIIVAWLAQLNPVSSLIIAFLFSVLEKGSSVVQSQFGLSTDCADVLQGIILFFVLGCEFFIRYKFVRDKKQSTAEGGK
ncbi:ABC transporter permease [Butyricicoccus pullicaecorum]|uniref:Branched-chain amino acid ABC transporter permease n=1 Tax=Butyricicoccus pullicaecorum TaxID=501571 RepID=A0A1Y4LP39_9FIRM|nr:ABC transporter permease [Butyricicoccus pullicaecorum]OUP57640.1 branched-chain amino acid ABC transporter permease [Butyricicoccus pullicaecorum]